MSQCRCPLLAQFTHKYTEAGLGPLGPLHNDQYDVASKTNHYSCLLASVCSVKMVVALTAMAGSFSLRRSVHSGLTLCR